LPGIRRLPILSPKRKNPDFLVENQGFNWRRKRPPKLTLRI
jgi:hypothetical protein